MRRILYSLLVLGLVLGAGGMRAAQAESPEKIKPVAIVAVAGYDALMADLTMLGQLSDWPDLPQNVEGAIKLFTWGRGLKGLDTTKPLGILIQTDGEKYFGYALVPVTDAKALYESLQPRLKGATDVGGGVYRVESPHGPLFAKVKDGWAIVSRKQEALATAPADPAKVLGHVTRRYQAGVRLYLDNIPAKDRGKLVAKLRERIEKRMERCPVVNQHHGEICQMIHKRMLDRFAAAADDLSRVGLGWTVNRQTHKTAVELSVTAREGTKTQKRLAELDKAKSAFAGFQLPSAALAGDFSLHFPPPDDAELNALFDTLRKHVEERINKKAPSAEKAEKAKQWAGQVLEVVRETVKSGVIDGGGSLVLAPKASTLVTGRSVADSAKLEHVVKDVISTVQKNHPERPKDVKFDAETYEGIRLHTLTVVLPEKAKAHEKISRAFGDQINVVLGFDKTSVYLAAGKDAAPALKQAVAASKAAAGNAVPPVDIAVSLKDLTQFVAAVGNDRCKERAQKTLAAVEKAPSGQDHIRLTVAPKKNGVRYRLEFEEGAMRAMGTKRK